MLANFKNIQNQIIESTVYKKVVTVLSICFYYIHKKFLWGLFSAIDEKFFKFLFVGAINTLFSYFIYALFITIGLIPNIALAFQYIIGVLWSFKTTGVIVFKNHNNKLIFAFIGCYVFTFVINSIFLNILIKYLNEYLAQALLVLPIAMLSFLMLKFVVFK